MRRSFPDMTSRAFQLAHFIHPRRDVALTITRDAWAVVEAQLKKQKKRGYYVPLGRFLGGVKVKARTKVSFDDSQQLQSLVYLKSEIVEIKQEAQLLKEAAENEQGETQSPDGNQLDTFMLTTRSLPLTDDDWLIRFIKYLTSISTNISSFYVTLAVSREVFNYTTEEAVEMYYAIVPNEERWKDGQYFRKRRNEVVMKGLKERFGPVLQTRVVAHGEHRFRCRNDAERFAPLVKQCLEMFTPWNTECIHAGRWNPMDKRINELCFADADPEKEHPIETQRMHTLIHPECFVRLTTALKLASPNERLEVPMFFLNHTGTDNHSGGGSGSRRKSPEPLTDEELVQLESALKKQRKQREQARPDIVKVLVDGVERGKIRLNAKPVRVRIHQASRLIEIMSQDTEGELLLTSLLLEHRELRRAIPSSEYCLRLGRSQELLVTLSTTLDDQGEISGADLAVAFRRAESRSAIADIAEAITERARSVLRNPVWAFSTVAVVLIAAAIGVMLYRRQASPAEHVAQVQPEPSPLSSELGQTDSERRQENTPTQKAGQLPAPTMTPDPGIGSKNRSKPNDGKREGTRSLPGQVAVELAAIKRVFVEEHSLETDRSVRDAFIITITSSGKLTTTREADADAVLVWQVQHVGSSERIEARLMGHSGQTLWSASRIVARGENKATVATTIAHELVGRIIHR